MTGTASQVNISNGVNNRVLTAASSNTVNAEANLTFDGSTLSVGGDFNLASGKAVIDSFQIDGSTISNVNASPNQAIFIQPKGNANVKIGTNSSNNLECTGDIIAFSSSDRNLKENITPIPNALDKVNSLSGNTFNWKSSATTPEYFQGITDDTGVIAQEVEALGLPGITTTRDDGTNAVRYEKLIPVLIQAVKELSAKVTALEGS